MAFTNQDVTRVVKRLGQNGARFQFSGLREALGVEPADRNSSSRLHNYLMQLLAEDVVEGVPDGARKRNKYYRVKNEEKLRELAPGPTVPPIGVARFGPDNRLARIESGIQAIGERLEHIEARLNEIAAAWA